MQETIINVFSVWGSAVLVKKSETESAEQKGKTMYTEKETV